jgi:hypothetical protein
MLETNAMRFPSGEKLGDPDCPILAISVTTRSRLSAACTGGIPWSEAIDNKAPPKSSAGKTKRGTLFFISFLQTELFMERLQNTGG